MVVTLLETITDTEDNMYTQELKQYRLESFGVIKANHPTFNECLEIENVKKLLVGQYGFFQFRKGGKPKYIRVVRVY